MDELSILESDSTDHLRHQTTQDLFRVYFVIDAFQKLTVSHGKPLSKERCLAVADGFFEKTFFENQLIDFANSAESFTLCLLRRGACEVKRASSSNPQKITPGQFFRVFNKTNPQHDDRPNPNQIQWVASTNGAVVNAISNEFFFQVAGKRVATEILEIIEEQERREKHIIDIDHKHSRIKMLIKKQQQEKKLKNAAAIVVEEVTPSSNFATAAANSGTTNNPFSNKNLDKATSVEKIEPLFKVVYQSLNFLGKQSAMLPILPMSSTFQSKPLQLNPRRALKSLDNNTNQPLENQNESYRIISTQDNDQSPEFQQQQQLQQRPVAPKRSILAHSSSTPNALEGMRVVKTRISSISTIRLPTESVTVGSQRHGSAQGRVKTQPTLSTEQAFSPPMRETPIMKTRSTMLTSSSPNHEGRLFRPRGISTESEEANSLNFCFSRINSDAQLVFDDYSLQGAKDTSKSKRILPRYSSTRQFTDNNFPDGITAAARTRTNLKNSRAQMRSISSGNDKKVRFKQTPEIIPEQVDNLHRVSSSQRIIQPIFHINGNNTRSVTPTLSMTMKQDQLRSQDLVRMRRSSSMNQIDDNGMPVRSILRKKHSKEPNFLAKSIQTANKINAVIMKHLSGVTQQKVISVKQISQSQKDFIRSRMNQKI